MKSNPHSASPRFWVCTFLISGAISLACLPVAWIFKRLRWWDLPVNAISGGACVLCAISAMIYLIVARRAKPQAPHLGVPTRKLAFVALALTGGFLLLLVVLIALSILAPADF